MSLHIDSEDISTLLNFFPDGLCALDLESTGLSPLTDRIIELGAIKINATGEISTFQQLINPECPIPPKTTEIHGITDEMVASEPTNAQVITKFIDFLGSSTLVAHNAKFDIGFISFEIHRNDLRFPALDVYDSCQLARRFFRDFKIDGKKPENNKLISLCEFFEIKLENQHRALDDAFACLEVFLKILTQLKKRQVREVVKSGFNFNLQSFSEIKNYEIPEVVKPLVPKILTQPYIEIHYKSNSRKDPIRILRPIGILPMPHGVVLRAHCLESNHLKSYNLKRIRKLRFLDDIEIKKINDKIEQAKKEESNENQ